MTNILVERLSTVLFRAPRCVLSAGIAWCCGLPINRSLALDGSKYFRDLNTYHARKGTKCNIIGMFTCLMSFHPRFRCPDSDTS
jgi:hypothetical protein